MRGRGGAGKRRSDSGESSALSFCLFNLCRPTRLTSLALLPPHWLKGSPRALLSPRREFWRAEGRRRRLTPCIGRSYNINMATDVENISLTTTFTQPHISIETVSGQTKTATHYVAITRVLRNRAAHLASLTLGLNFRTQAGPAAASAATQTVTVGLEAVGTSLSASASSSATSVAAPGGEHSRSGSSAAAASGSGSGSTPTSGGASSDLPGSSTAAPSQIVTTVVSVSTASNGSPVTSTVTQTQPVGSVSVSLFPFFFNPIAPFTRS